MPIIFQLLYRKEIVFSNLQIPQPKYPKSFKSPSFYPRNHFPTTGFHLFTPLPNSKSVFFSSLPQLSASTPQLMTSKVRLVTSIPQLMTLKIRSKMCVFDAAVALIQMLLKTGKKSIFVKTV